jgi:DNA repair exonuclease SbcCD nuclease subunit
MRVALVSDTHADVARRFDEHERVMTWIAEDIARREVDLVCHSGDWFERAVTADRERAAVGGWVQQVCEHAPLVGVGGNHDSPLDVEWLGRLRTRHPLHIHSVPGVVEVAGCAVATLPWPRRASLLAALGRPVSHEESGAVAQECLRNILRGLGLQLDAFDLPRLFVGHVDLDGAVTDHDQPVVGGDMRLSLADLSLVRADFYGLGHIHQGAGNEWTIGDAPCVFAGAPRHNNFGEAKEGKGYVIAEIDPATRRVTFERIATPCRRMVLLEEAWSFDEALGGFTWSGWARSEVTAEALDVRDAEVRLRIDVDADQRDAMRGELAKWVRSWILEERGAHSLKIEERVRATTRARAPEVAAAKTTADMLRAHWASKGTTPAAERAARLLDRLAEAEAALRAA